VGSYAEGPGLTWVMLDYGRVISQAPADRDVEGLAAVAGAEVPDLLEQYWRWRRAYDLAELDACEYWARIGAALGRDYPGDVIAELVRLDCESWLHLSAGTVALVEELAGTGHRLALLSNAPADVAAAVAGLPLARRFEQLLFSCYLSCAKPDPRCFALALGRLGARPAEVIFVDDLQANVAAAEELGIAAVRYVSPQQARQAVLALLAGAA
jgi:putative hydrolase of the HAD superfamily